jgi:hypothetical protein
VQAKSLSGYMPRQRSLASYIWQSLKAREFITAFSKTLIGGSIYFGVSEFEGEIKCWTEEPLTCVKVTCDASCRDHTGGPLKVWAEHKPSNRICYRLAPENEVPKVKKTTGFLNTEGIRITSQEQDNLCTELCKLLETLTWLGKSNHEPSEIEIVFHQVNNSPSPDKVVIEMKIPPFDGVCFRCEEGPEAYIPVQNSFEKMKKEDWLARFRCKFELSPDWSFTRWIYRYSTITHPTTPVRHLLRPLKQI